MPGKARITIVGAGNLARALAPALHASGYDVELMVRSKASVRLAREFARKTAIRVVTMRRTELTSSVVWFCVPDSQISIAAKSLRSQDWQGRVALHSSGALTSDELNVLRRKGASTASVHPLMTFVRASQPSLQGVPFAMEGDPTALRFARRVVHDLDGTAHAIRKEDKAAYHAWGTFASPLLTAFFATTEAVARAAGVKGSDARKRMLPILRQTLANYGRLGAPDSFSGPIVRGDVATVKRHWQALKKNPTEREVYRALARAAMRYLPVKNANLLRKVIK